MAWYPEDSTDFNTLKKYADFAMYQVKHSRKGEMKEFDIGMYNQEAYAMQTRSEFEQMLRDQAVSYHFQPIFSARSGRAIAYEALMRPEMPTLRSPLTVMKLARELNRLYDIEHITLFKASSAFEKLKERGLIREDSLLFINSIASVSLNDTDWRDYRGRFPELARKLVVEITEEEELDPAQLERKRTVAGASGVFALDDYGSGYSNGSSLLTIAPAMSRWISPLSAALIPTRTSSSSSPAWWTTRGPGTFWCWPRVWRPRPSCARCWSWAWTCCRATVWPARQRSRRRCPRKPRTSSAG